jgi:hypothetical protein
VIMAAIALWIGIDQKLVVKLGVVDAAARR